MYTEGAVNPLLENNFKLTMCIHSFYNVYYMSENWQYFDLHGDYSTQEVMCQVIQKLPQGASETRYRALL